MTLFIKMVSLLVLILPLLSVSANFSNFSSVLSPFEGCLIEIKNYEGIDLIQTSDVKVPLILIRYALMTVQPSSGSKPMARFFPYEYTSRPESVALNTSNFTYAMPYTDISTRTRFQWKCFARLHLLPPKPDLKAGSKLSSYRDNTMFYVITHFKHGKCKENWIDVHLFDVSGSFIDTQTK